MHYHVTNEAVLCQLAGSKLVALLPPNVSDAGMLYDKASKMRNWAVGGATAHSGIVADPRATLVRLQPTDCLYIPLRWWHVIFGVEGEISIAIAHFWDATPAMLRQISEPNPLPTGLDDNYFAPGATGDTREGDVADRGEVAQVDSAVVRAMAPDTDDEESESRHGEARGSRHDAAIVPTTQCRQLKAPQWRCGKSDGVTSTRPDLQDDQALDVACPVLAKAGDEAAWQYRMVCSDAACHKFCSIQRACAATHATPADAEPHLQLARVLLGADLPSDQCSDGQNQCAWTCPQPKHVQQALVHVASAHRLLHSTVCTPSTTSTCERSRASLLTQLNATLAALAARSELQSQLRRHATGNDAALLELDMRILGPHPPLAFLKDQAALPSVRPRTLITLGGGGEVAHYRAEDLEPMPRGGWQAHHGALATLIDENLEQSCTTSEVTTATDLNYEHFRVQDALQYGQAAAAACHFATGVPNLPHHPEWRVARDAMLRAAFDYEEHSMPNSSTSPLSHLEDHCDANLISGDPWHPGKRSGRGMAATVSSKRDGSMHDWHTHIESTITGVYYVSVPPGSGPIIFDDGVERVTFKPAAGDVIVFPSWLRHMANVSRFDEAVHVAGSHLASRGRVSRVSISFDLEGPWRLPTRAAAQKQNHPDGSPHQPADDAHAAAASPSLQHHAAHGSKGLSHAENA